MDLKVIEMLNNYPDGYSADLRIKPSLGRFCVLGYYDGLNVKLNFGEEDDSDTIISEWKCKNSTVIPHLTGTGKITSLCVQLCDAPQTGGNSEKLKEKEFTLWDENHELPLLTVSMIRTKKTEDASELFSVVNERSNMIAYYSYEHCELIIVFRSKSYRDVIATIRWLYETKLVLKIYSVLAIAEKLIDDPQELKTRMEPEDICVRMNASMRDRDKMEQFLEKLRDAFGQYQYREGFKIEKYDLLGDDDLLIEINHVPLESILPLYADRKLLNHGNKDYSDAFYNVETKFLLPSGTNLTEETESGLRSEQDQMGCVLLRKDHNAEFGDNGTGKRNAAAKDDETGNNNALAKHSETGNREELFMENKADSFGVPDEDACWIYKDLDVLRKIYQDAEYKNEKALLSYISCMIRLLNSLVQIATSDFHRYERKILLNPMRIFMKYFIDEVRIIKETEETRLERKIEVLQNVEDAVCAVTDIYENVLNGTANTDKQMFLALPLNSSIYELSPKLYAYYSDIMSDILNIFDQEHQYAFFLNPTLKRTLQEEVLFEEREEKGKVVIIDIPVRMMDDVEYLPLYMIHEMFHVLTSEERNRKLRAARLFACLVSQIEEGLFAEVEFLNADTDRKMKKDLFQSWFGQSTKKIKTLYRNEDENSKRFYGKNITRILNEETKRDLLFAEKHAAKDVINLVVAKKEEYKIRINELNAFDDAYNTLMKQAEVIRDNVHYMLYNGYINYCSGKLMFLFKESYADVVMLLITEYSYDRYKSAFARSAQFRMDEKRFRDDNYFIVRKTIVNLVINFERKNILLEGKLTNAGMNAYREMIREIRNAGLTAENNNIGLTGSLRSYDTDYVYDALGENDGQINGRYVIISPGIFFCLLDYLFTCKEDINSTIEKLNEQEKKSWDRLKLKLCQKTWQIISGSKSEVPA